MHVGIFTESFPPLVNGVSTSVCTLIAQLEQAGHRVSVFTSRFPHHQDQRPDVYRFPSVNSLVEPDYVLPIPISRQIAAAIRGLKMDIVHSQSPFLLGLLARRVARRTGIPLVSTNHTLYTEYTHYMPMLPPRLTRRLTVDWMRAYYNSCDQVLVPSELTRQRLLTGCGVHTPVQVIPTGIPAPPYLLQTPQDTRRLLGVAADSRLLLYVGRLAPEKNLPMLLHAFQQIAAQAPQAVLVVAGSGKSASSLRRLARRLGLADRIVFTGFLERTRLDPLYAAADVFLFPSRTETQGLAVGEALAAGTPAVVVNVGGAPESVRDGEDGFLIEDDPAAMAACTLRLLQDAPLHRRMAEQARLRAREWTPERVAGRVIAIYEDLIADPTRRFGASPAPSRLA